MYCVLLSRQKQCGSAFSVELVRVRRFRRLEPVWTFLHLGVYTTYVSKRISVSEDGYRRLKREKGDRSFSEVIAEKLAAGSGLSEVSGAGILDPETNPDVADEIDRLSDGTMDRFDDESP